MKKKETFLKFIILEKFAAGVVEIAISFGILSLLYIDMEAFTLKFAGFFHLNIDNQYVRDAILKIRIMKPGTILEISLVVFLMGVLALVEAWGLHLRRRWAEWLTIIATGLFIPFELYEVIKSITAFKVAALALNCAIVWYLAKHKELFTSKRQTVFS
jgi:uncharacterized membrane protein (DUF2068 family)